MQTWQEPSSGFNLIQLAIVSNYRQVVEYLLSGKYIFLYREIPSEPKINLPLHLACKVGSLQIIKYILHVALESEGDNAVYFMLKDPGIVTHPYPATKQAHISAKTPFELCVEGGNIDCALHLSKLIMKYLSASFTGSPCYTYTDDSSMLHDACYLGSPAFLRLLLERGHVQDIGLKNQMGYQPLHVAASQHHAECMDILLQYGARVNSIAECKSALHLAYGYKANAENLVVSTEVLVKHQININMMDHNHNTALGYLAWEFGQRYTQNPFLKTHKYSLLQADYSRKREITSTEEYKEEIYRCMEILLENGATTMVRTSDNRVDHTLVHTLLQNTGYPLSTCLTTNPEDVYRVLELFFAYESDPNLVARNNNESAFAMLIVYTLKEITSVDMKCKFLHLFIMNGANLGTNIPEPRQYWENYPHRLWNIYPALLALQEQHPMPVIHLFYRFMGVRVMFHSFRQMEDRYLWYRITTGVSFSNSSGDASIKYKDQWKAMKKELIRPRSLKHHCKLVVLCALRNKGKLTELLPLPTFLKQYVVAAVC